MDTMHAAAPTRPRWFAGLRRSRSRLLGGVAGGFAEFWEVDPLLVRVLAASPLLAAMVAFVGQVVLGLYWTVPVTQLLWLISAGTIAAYLIGWMLIPHPDAASLARRFLAWGGPLGTLAKLTVGFVLLIGFGWLGLGTLGYVGALDDLSPLVYVTGMLVTVGGLATLGVWLARGGDLRDALHRLGSPGFGRTDTLAPAAWVDPAPGDADPTLVLDVDGEPTVTLPDPGQTAGEPTLVLDSVDRARAAATAAADARAAAAEAQRRARAEARRARRAERRERNRWGWLVAAVTLITAGTLVLTDRAGVTTLGWAGIAMICLSLLTTGVLVGAWFGSARWLIAPALLLAGLIAAGGLASDALDQAAAAPPITIAPEGTTRGRAVRHGLGGRSGHRGPDQHQGARLAGPGSDRGPRVADRDHPHRPMDRGLRGGDAGAQQPHLRRCERGALRAAVRSTGPTDMAVPAGGQPLYLDLHVGVGELTLIEQES